ncbi:MAG: hypothetical protein KAQ75_03710, partial [Bacteroidales bacterium]|nr:hypothetical protein [Bacteroidales bacterium]
DPSGANTITLPDASGTVALDNNGVSALTTAEVDQLENIDLVTITNAQWAYLGATDQVLATTDNVTFNQITGTLQTAAQTNITSVGTLTGLTVSGAASLEGTVDLGNAATDVITVTGEIAGANPLVFEGVSADDVYTTLAVVDPSGANTIILPDASGTVAVTLTATAALNFGSTGAQISSDLTITVNGAADGNVVSLGVPNTSVNANSNYTAWVSAANTVTVRFNNYSAGAIDPALGTFRVSVLKY